MKTDRQEQLDFLNKHLSFPCTISFILLIEKDDSTAILSTEIKNKSKLENIKYSHVRGGTWTSKGSAVLSVKSFSSAEEYLKEFERLHNLWGFALRKVDENGTQK